MGRVVELAGAELGELGGQPLAADHQQVRGALAGVHLPAGQGRPPHHRHLAPGELGEPPGRPAGSSRVFSSGACSLQPGKRSRLSSTVTRLISLPEGVKGRVRARVSTTKTPQGVTTTWSMRVPLAGTSWKT